MKKVSTNFHRIKTTEYILIEEKITVETRKYFELNDN